MSFIHSIFIIRHDDDASAMMIKKKERIKKIRRRSGRSAWALMRKFSKSTFFCELDIKLNNENRHSSNFSFLRLLSCALFHVSSGKLFFC